MDYGSVIREKREKANMSQAELAKQLGVSQPCIARYERNTLAIPLGIVPELTKILNFDANELFADCQNSMSP